MCFKIVEVQRVTDDETTAVPLQKKLLDNGRHHSLKTILKSRERLGWTFRDNDPKHSCRRAVLWLENINWWKTPPESPDINPIENLWHETNQEVIKGIFKHWDTVTIDKCQKYIKHLRKVVPKIIKANSGPTGY
uniref:Tc1-like transposase DDE domain-containing protein n=1 Tax=Amphimedon queenslandica TaxID=400682 RepID=A0A1X7TWU8_AMPQE